MHGDDGRIFGLGVEGVQPRASVSKSVPIETSSFRDTFAELLRPQNLREHCLIRRSPLGKHTRYDEVAIKRCKPDRTGTSKLRVRPVCF